MNNPDDTEEIIEVPELASVQDVELITSPPELTPSPDGIEEIIVPGTIPIQEGQRHLATARLWIAAILSLAFLATALWVLATATFGAGTAWANTKEALQILLPVESSLLGSAVVFYFTGSGEQR